MIKKNFSDNKKNIAKISSGTLLGQALAIIIIPVITRIYGPNIIGVWTLLNSISTIVISVSDLGMVNSIMTEDEDNIVTTYGVITSIVAFISLISAICITYYYSEINNLEINTIFLFFMVLFMVFIPQQIQVCYTWLNRKGEYSVLMKNPIIQNGATGIISITLGLIGFTSYGYFLGKMAGLLVTLLHMRRKLPSNSFIIDIEKMKRTLERNKKFVVFQTPTRALNNFLNQLPALLIQGLWGTKTLGYYSITVQILQIPSTLLANAIGRVFFQSASKLKREGRPIGQYVYSNVLTGMKLGIIPMTFLMAFGDIIANVFLGFQWEIAGNFVRILSLQYFFMFLMNTVLGLEIVLEKQKYKLIVSLFQIIGFTVGALIGKYIFNNIYLGLILMSFMYIILHIVYFCALFKSMDLSRKQYVKNVIKSILTVAILSALTRIIFDFFGIADYLYYIIR